MKLRSATLSVAALLVIALDTSAQEPPRARHIAAQSLADVRAWDSAVDRMARDGDLTLRQHRTDPLFPRRTHDRYDQFYQGVRVFGGDLVRQLDNGLTISISEPCTPGSRSIPSRRSPRHRHERPSPSSPARS